MFLMFSDGRTTKQNLHHLTGVGGRAPDIKDEIGDISFRGVDDTLSGARCSAGWFLTFWLTGVSIDSNESCSTKMSNIHSKRLLCKSLCAVSCLLKSLNNYTNVCQRFLAELNRF